MDDMSMSIQLPRIPFLPRVQQVRRLLEQAIAARTVTRTGVTTRSSTKLDTLDLALFVTYFCTVVTSCFMFVTLPSIAAEFVTHPEAVTAFVAGVASTAPLGGGVGKLVNGFVCERLGGKQSSWIYLVGLGCLSLSLSNAKSAASIGLLLAGCEFLTSIQWTSAISILDVHYKDHPAKMVRGIALMSTASACGAMLAKTGGAALMKLSSWRTLVQCGAGVAFLGASCMLLGVKSQAKKQQRTFVISPSPQMAVVVLVSDEKEKQPSRLVSSISSTSSSSSSSSSTTGKSKPSLSSCLKAMFKNPIFWMIGLANTVGYVARSDSMLSAFLVSTTALPSKSTARTLRMDSCFL
jgi:sugar phosphate permease